MRFVPRASRHPADRLRYHRHDRSQQTTQPEIPWPQSLRRMPHRSVHFQAAANLHDLPQHRAGLERAASATRFPAALRLQRLLRREAARTARDLHAPEQRTEARLRVLPSADREAVAVDHRFAPRMLRLPFAEERRSEGKSEIGLRRLSHSNGDERPTLLGQIRQPSLRRAIHAQSARRLCERRLLRLPHNQRWLQPADTNLAQSQTTLESRRTQWSWMFQLPRRRSPLRTEGLQRRAGK